MVTQVRDEKAIKAFAENVGEWLLTQRFGTIVPFNYRWRCFEPPADWPDEGDHVEFNLVVEDPPPPPAGWRDLPEEEIPAVLIWPEGDMRAAERAAHAYALGLDIPQGLAPLRPVSLVFHARSEVEGDGRLPFYD